MQHESTGETCTSNEPDHCGAVGADIGNHCLRPDRGSNRRDRADDGSGRAADISCDYHGASHGCSAAGGATLRGPANRSTAAHRDASAGGDGRVSASAA
jgi:hypothetical protein